MLSLRSRRSRSASEARSKAVHLRASVRLQVWTMMSLMRTCMVEMIKVSERDGKR